MKITYIITRSDWGGAQAHLYDLIEYAHINTDHSCHLIVGEEGRLAEQVRGLGIPVTIVPTLIQPIHPLKDILAVRDLVGLLKQINPDIVHLHSSKAGMVGRIAARILRLPAIFTAHGWAFTDGVSSFRRMISLPLERWVARYSQRIICVSEYDRQLALQYKVGGPEQLVTVHNGIPDINEKQLLSHENSNEKREALRCIMVARFSAQKDYATLLYATSRVTVPIELHLAGQGELITSMRNLAKELRIEDKTNFLGPRSDIPELLSSNDVFVLTTNYEGFPISILEAMRAGLPVIATDVGGVSEAVIDGETGYLVSRGDSKAVQERIEILAKNLELRRKMGEAGRRRFLENFSSQKMIDKTFSLYKEVLNL
jgi:glycosyltransferase involved in cell wall biosynthesis